MLYISTSKGSLKIRNFACAQFVNHRKTFCSINLFVSFGYFLEFQFITLKYNQPPIAKNYSVTKSSGDDLFPVLRDRYRLIKNCVSVYRLSPISSMLEQRTSHLLVA